MGFGLCSCKKGIKENSTELIPDFETNYSSQDNISPSIISDAQVKISQFGEFKPSLNITSILDKINCLVNKIDIPQDKINRKKLPNIIKLPLFEYKDGEKYEGEWNYITNEREGYGISIYPDNKIYKGFWKNNKYGDYGSLFDENGNYYVGELAEGKAEGKGEIIMNQKFKYIGDFKENLPFGEGELENYEDNSVYIGHINYGIKEGKGKITFNDGTVYEGNFENDQFNGIGKIEYSDGSSYEGEFKKNKKEGKGIYKWDDGKYYEGEFVNDVKQGKGRLYIDKNRYYEGTWINDKKHGKGYYSVDGELLEGVFRFDKIILENS